MLVFIHVHVGSKGLKNSKWCSSVQMSSFQGCLCTCRRLLRPRSHTRWEASLGNTGEDGVGWIFCSIITVHQMSCQKVFFSLIHLEFIGRLLLISKFPLYILLTHNTLLTWNLSVLLPSKVARHIIPNWTSLADGTVNSDKDQENNTFSQSSFIWGSSGPASNFHSS